MSISTRLLNNAIRIFLEFCDRYFPLKPGEHGTTREYQSRSFILVFMHTAFVVTLHTINNLVTVGWNQFVRGFLVVDILVIIGFLIIRFYPKAERIAGPYMCLHLLAVACGVAYNGRSPVTGLGLWWPLWVFWTFMIAGRVYGVVITGLAACGAAIFLFGPFLSTPLPFDFGFTAQGFARFLTIDVTMVSTLGLLVTMLFRHFMATTHTTWLTAKDHTDQETRYRMLSRFAGNIHDRLQPDIRRLQDLCSALQQNAYSPKERATRLAIIAESRKRIGNLASFNRNLLILTPASPLESTRHLTLLELVSNSQSIQIGTAMTLNVVWQVDSGETLPRSMAEVLQIFFATIFMLVHDQNEPHPSELLITGESTSYTFAWHVSGASALHNLMDEICNDCSNLLEDLRGRADCEWVAESQHLAVIVSVPKQT